MVRFGQRIECDQTLGPRQRGCVFLPVFEQCGETLQYLEDASAVIFAKWRDPVVVESEQKVVFIELRCGAEKLNLPLTIIFCSRRASLRNRRLELNDVDRRGKFLAPTNREMIDHQRVAFSR